MQSTDKPKVIYGAFSIKGVEVNGISFKPYFNRKELSARIPVTFNIALTNLTESLISLKTKSQTTNSGLDGFIEGSKLLYKIKGSWLRLVSHELGGMQPLLIQSDYISVPAGESIKRSCEVILEGNVVSFGENRNPGLSRDIYTLKVTPGDEVSFKFVYEFTDNDSTEDYVFIRDKSGEPRGQVWRGKVESNEFKLSIN